MMNVDDSPAIGAKHDATVPLLTIASSDYITDPSEQDAPFDILLRQRWTAAAECGAMKYNILRQPLPTRILPSSSSLPKYNFVAMLIEGRAPGKRRPPQEMLALRQPFDPTKFNFSKIEPDELLFRIKTNGKNGPDGTQVHSVIVNKSPISFGSSLLVPSLERCLPQVVSHFISNINL